MTDTSTEAIAALMDGVTPGQWELRGKQTIGSGINTVASCGWKNGRKDAPFIVACHKLVPALAAERDTLRAEVERLRYVIDGVRGAIDTGRNEPLQIWRDQVAIALQAIAALKGASNG